MRAMRSMVESLNMFMLDYLIVPIWAVFSIMGNKNSARILIPITFIFLMINYFNTRNTTKFFLLDINLAAASVAGVILNTFLYIKFIYADPQIITDMISIIFLYTLGIIAFCMICLMFKVLMHKRNMRIISRMASGAYDAEDSYEYEDDDDDDYDDDDDEDYDDEAYNAEIYDASRRRGFLSSISNFLTGGDEYEEDEDDSGADDSPEDDDDGYVKPDGPKFRVVKK